jgi:hypothetical protein
MDQDLQVKWHFNEDKQLIGGIRFGAKVSFFFFTADFSHFLGQKMKKIFLQFWKICF